MILPNETAGIKLKRKVKGNGFVLYRGIKNGKRFAVIVTLKTRNKKTGKMAQIWFLLEDVNPVEAVKTGLDARTICNGCRFAAGNGCYVNVGQAPLSIWKAFKRGVYKTLDPVDYSAVFSGRKVRFGAYGNPSLLPLSIVKAISGVSSGWTGYFHDWKTNPLAAEYAKYFMASTETASSLALAQSLKFRTFHVSPVKPQGLRECLSDSHGLQCADCKLCAGLSKASQASIWINPHGAKSGRANAAALSTVN